MKQENKYPESIWQFQRNFLTAGNTYYSVNNDFWKKYRRDYRLLIVEYNDVYSVSFVEENTRKGVLLLGRGLSEEEAIEKVKEYIEKIKRKYQLKELLTPCEATSN